MQTQNRRTAVKRVVCAAISVLALSIAAGSEQMYAPFSEYQMSRQAEIALARSAAPGTVSQHATIEVLTPKGYEIAVKGDGAFVCMVLRSWSAAPDPAVTRQANIRGPACFDAVAAKTVVPAEELKVKLGLAGKPPEEIDREVTAQYKLGKLPKMQGTSFAYMWSASQKIGPDAGPWHPHMMVYAPYYKNQFLGNNAVGGHAAPFAVGDDTPYCIVMIPVDDKLAIKAADQ